MGKLFPEHHIDNVLRYQAFVQFSVRLFPAVFCNASAFVFIVQKVGYLVDEIIVGTEKDHFIIGEQLIQVELLVGKDQNTNAGEFGYPVR